MTKYRCYWCKKYVGGSELIRRDGLGFCCEKCVTGFFNNGYEGKKHGRK